MFSFTRFLITLFGRRPAPLRRRRRLEVEELENRVTPAIFTWNGPVAGGNWSNAANWLVNNAAPANPPGAADAATFSNADVFNSTVDANFTGTVGSLTMSGYTGTITLARALTVAGALNQDNGAITGAFPITANGGGIWSGGTLGGDGNAVTSPFVIPQNTTFDIRGNVNFAGRIIQNSGLVAWRDSTITESNGGYFANLATGTLAAQPGMETMSGDGAFFNTGFVYASPGATMNFGVNTTSYQGTFKADVTNVPSVPPSFGVINFNGSTTIFGGAPADTNPAQTANLTGGGQIDFNNSASISGPTNSDNADLGFGGSTSISASLGIDAGNVTFSGPTQITASLTVGGGTVYFQSEVTIAATAQTTVGAGATLVMNGGFLFLNDGSLTNGGTFYWNGGLIALNGAATITNNSIFNIAPNGEWMTGTGSFTNANNGKITVSTSGTIWAQFVNDDLLELKGGTFTIEHDWTQAVGGKTHFEGGNLAVNGNLTNDGDISVFSPDAAPMAQIFVNTLTNNGDIRMFHNFSNLTPVTLAILPLPNIANSGNFVQGAAGTLGVMIIDPANATDVLAVSGTATLSGTLSVSAGQDSVPGNTSWTVITASQVNGSFGTITLPFPILFVTYYPDAVTIYNRLDNPPPPPPPP